MPPDPNAGLIKALKDHAGVLSENTKAVKEHTKELKEGRRTRFAAPQPHPYLEPTTAHETQTEEYQGPYGSGPSQSDR